jgi:hypothetical protein
VDGLGNNNLIEIIIVTLIRCGGLRKEDVLEKLLCFGANGAFVFKRGEHVLQGKLKVFGHSFQRVFIGYK